MFFQRKKVDLHIERFEGFRVQTTYSCKGVIKTQFFDMNDPVDENFIEYLKPFGYPILIGGKTYEIMRENSVRLMIAPGSKNFQARYTRNCDPYMKTKLISQVQKAVKKNPPGDLPTRCSEGALSIDNNNGARLTIVAGKCTCCLDCV